MPSSRRSGNASEIRGTRTISGRNALLTLIGLASVKRWYTVNENPVLSTNPKWLRKGIGSRKPKTQIPEVGRKGTVLLPGHSPNQERGVQGDRSHGKRSEKTTHFDWCLLTLHTASPDQWLRGLPLKPPITYTCATSKVLILKMLRRRVVKNSILRCIKYFTRLYSI